MPARAPKRLGSWRDNAACVSVDNLDSQARVELFFPERSHAQAARAKKVCWEQCPVRQQCLDEAIENKERFGIWGGLDTQERQAEAKRRRRRGEA